MGLSEFSHNPEKYNSRELEPNDPLGAEWARQSQNYLTLGFHQKLGLSEEEYLDSLPPFLPNTEERKQLSLTVPLLVDSRIDVREQINLAGIKIINRYKRTCNYWGLRDRDMLRYYELDLSRENLVRRDEIKKPTPIKPYVTWVQSGDKYLNVSPYYVGRDVTISFARGQSNEKIGTIYEGTSLAIHYPQKLKRNELVLMGTEIGFKGEGTPVLFDHGTGIYLGVLNIGVAVGERNRGLFTCSWPLQTKSE
jgi:hypothetical protein